MTTSKCWKLPALHPAAGYSEEKLCFTIEPCDVFLRSVRGSTLLNYTRVTGGQGQGAWFGDLQKVDIMYRITVSFKALGRHKNLKAFPKRRQVPQPFQTAYFGFCC